MARKKIESTIGADFLEIGKESRSKKIERALQLSPAATGAPAENTKNTKNTKNTENTKQEAAALTAVNVRVPRETRDTLQLMAGEECLPMAVYMRQLLAAVADPATAAPELSQKLLQIDRDRPRNTTILKQQINKRESGPMVGIGARVPEGTAAALQEAAAFRKLTVSLYLRYIFVSLADSFTAAAE